MIELKRILEKRNLPNVMMDQNSTVIKDDKMWANRRQEIVQLLGSQVYGFSPPAPSKVLPKLVREDKDAFAGKAVHSVIDLSFDTPRGEFSFPVNLIIPEVFQANIGRNGMVS